MPNQDYPDVCMSCSNENCDIIPPDLDAVRERMKLDPMNDYTANMINNLSTALPEKFKSKEEAYLVFDVFKAVIANGLKNRDDVSFKGLGKFNVQGNKVVYTPDPALEAAVAE